MIEYTFDIIPVAYIFIELQNYNYYHRNYSER